MTLAIFTVLLYLLCTFTTVKFAIQKMFKNASSSTTVVPFTQKKLTRLSQCLSVKIIDSVFTWKANTIQHLPVGKLVKKRNIKVLARTAKLDFV